MVEYCKQEHNIQQNIILALPGPISKEGGLRRVTVQPCLGAAVALR